MTLALVTGGTGMLGSHIVERLVEAGVEVRALVRPGSDARLLEAMPIEILRGEATDESTWQKAVVGVDLVFHGLGKTSAASIFSGDTEAHLYTASNVDPTEALLRACMNANIKRFVFISTVSVYHIDSPAPIPETARWEPYSAYGRSKLVAEGWVRECQSQGLATTIIRPTIMYGPRDRHFTPIAIRLARMPLLPLVDGGRCPVDLAYVTDVVELVWRASQENVAIGREYNAGPGMRTTLRELNTAYDELTGKGARILPLSAANMRRFAWFFRRFLAFWEPGTDEFVSSVGLQLMSRDMHFDTTRAKTELGYAPSHTLKEGLRKAIGLDGGASQVRAANARGS